MAQEWAKTTFIIRGANEQILSSLALLRNNLKTDDLFRSFYIGIKTLPSTERAIKKARHANIQYIKPKNVLANIKDSSIKVLADGPYGTWKTYTEFDKTLLVSLAASCESFSVESSIHGTYEDNGCRVECADGSIHVEQWHTTNDTEYEAWEHFLKSKLPYESLPDVLEEYGYNPGLKFNGEYYVDESGGEYHHDDYLEILEDFGDFFDDLYDEFLESDEYEACFEREKFDIDITTRCQ